MPRTKDPIGKAHEVDQTVVAFLKTRRRRPLVVMPPIGRMRNGSFVYVLDSHDHANAAPPVVVEFMLDSFMAPGLQEDTIRLMALSAS
jgi:hypothetical protein